MNYCRYKKLCIARDAAKKSKMVDVVYRSYFIAQSNTIFLFWDCASDTNSGCNDKSKYLDEGDSSSYDMPLVLPIDRPTGRVRDGSN